MMASYGKRLTRFAAAQTICTVQSGFCVFLGKAFFSWRMILSENRVSKLQTGYPSFGITPDGRDCKASSIANGGYIERPWRFCNQACARAVKGRLTAFVICLFRPFFAAGFALTDAGADSLRPKSGTIN
jgi:hypothetical protein